MQNLEQIRARNAFNFSKKGSISGKCKGEVINKIPSFIQNNSVTSKSGSINSSGVINKIPSFIQNNGLLAAAAFSFQENDGWRKVFDAIAEHLADKDIAVVPRDKVTDRKTLLDYLTSPSTTSETLKLATTETMAWLMYARRFVSKKETK